MNTKNIPRKYYVLIKSIFLLPVKLNMKPIKKNLLYIKQLYAGLSYLFMNIMDIKR